jgi:uncharacterized membrane protein
MFCSGLSVSKIPGASGCAQSSLVVLILVPQLLTLVPNYWQLYTNLQIHTFRGLVWDPPLFHAYFNRIGYEPW